MHVVLMKNREPAMCITGDEFLIGRKVIELTEYLYVPTRVSVESCPICQKERELLSQVPKHKVWP